MFHTHKSTPTPTWTHTDPYTHTVRGLSCVSVFLLTSHRIWNHIGDQEASAIPLPPPSPHCLGYKRLHTGTLGYFVDAVIWTQVPMLAHQALLPSEPSPQPLTLKTWYSEKIYFQHFPYASKLNLRLRIMSITMMISTFL